MKKMIFAVSALALTSALFSPYTLAADGGEPGRVDADPAYDADADMSKAKTTPDTTTSPSQNKHAKKHKRAKVVVAAPMKDQAPTSTEAPKPYCWLDNVSGNMTMASNYTFRGISQTRNLPAVQGSLTYQFPIGLYLNAWGSNVKFDETDATVEIDSIVGWRGDIWEEFSYDLSVARYNYPGAHELNYNEFNGVVNYKILQLGYSYSADVFATHSPGRYYLIGLNYDIPCEYLWSVDGVSVHATTGHYTLPKAAGNSYNDYSAWVSKKIKNYLFTVQWTGTNGRQHASPIDDNQLFALVSAEF